MTKEELEKEAEDFTDSKKSFWRQGRTCIDSVKQAYITGAEPREKRIAELEKEKAELKARLNAINLLTPELEKSAKLKKQQLTKAKEFLNEFMRISKAIDEDFDHDYSELIGETDQFLKEKA